MPYFSVEMPNGTPCDINEQPRKTNVLYVCHLSANNEVFFFCYFFYVNFFIE